MCLGTQWAIQPQEISIAGLGGRDVLWLALFYKGISGQENGTGAEGFYRDTKDTGLAGPGEQLDIGEITPLYFAF